MKQSIADRIRFFREERGWTQDELADAASMNRVTIAKYELGMIEPKSKSLSKLASAFGIGTDELLGTPMAHEMTDEERDLWALREEVRRDPERRILFSLARNANIEDVRRAVAVIDALKKASEGGNDNDPA